MKITKAQLKELIQEELSEVVPQGLKIDFDEAFEDLLGHAQDKHPDDKSLKMLILQARNAARALAKHFKTAIELDKRYKA